MREFFLAEICKDLTDPKTPFYPIGIILKERVQKIVKSLRYEEIPEQFKNNDSISNSIFSNLEKYLKDAKCPSPVPLTINISSFKYESKGTIEEQVEELFVKKILKFK